MPALPTPGASPQPIGSSAAYRELIELIPEPTLLVDGQAAVVLDANRAALALFGVSQVELLGLSIDGLCPVNQPDGIGSADHYADLLGQTLDAGEHNGVTVHLRARGGSIPCAVRLRRLGGASDGSLVAAGIEPIAERGHYERDLLAHAVLESPMPILALRLDGTVRFGNAAACRALGYDAEELDGLTVASFDPGWQAVFDDADARERLAGGALLRRDSVQRHCDGSEFAVRLSMFRVSHVEEELLFALVEPAST